jgi:signal transduction histidine kinase
MKYLTLIILCFLFQCLTYGQQNVIDSLKNIVSEHKEDTSEVKALVHLEDIYIYINLDSAINFAQQGLLLARKIGYSKGEADCYLGLGVGLGYRGNLSQAIQFYFKALSIYEQMHEKDGVIASHMLLQGIYRSAGDYTNSLKHAFIQKNLLKKDERIGTILFSGKRLMPLLLAEIGGTYEEMNRLDSALVYTQQAIKENLHINGATWNFPIFVLGRIQTRQGKYKLAGATFRTAIPLAIKNGYPKDTLDIYNSIASLFKASGDFDSAIYYAKSILNNHHSTSYANIRLQAATTLAHVYKLKGEKDSTLQYIELSAMLKDSIHSQEKQREFQNLTFNEQLRQQEIQQLQIQDRNKIRFYSLVVGLLSLAIITLILYSANIQKQRANRLLQKQKAEIDQQRTKAEAALEELKATQAQLLQREKMASLGELTAGIAHEIQNPLNFVNNFSEVNTELIDEAGQEIDKGNIEEVKLLLSGIKDNEQKITQHGRRADAIVKGMLQHSRSSSGKKEPTDINALADEYLRLSFHGLRAKDKTFNATRETHFDENLQKIAIIPQDIGRVLLNLYNNAFYAVSEKKKLQDDKYEPTVSVSTKKINNKVEIKVSDNGNGIPQKVLDKIFQPFFTTKPTGQGTGLGLSLSYDIIKAHGGEIKVETKEGVATGFIIKLPIMPI